MKWITILFLLVPKLALANEAPSCSALKRALASKSSLEIRVIFGYKDARPARYVGDRHERLAFIERVTSPCQGENLACGFDRDSSDADLFKKPVTMGGRTANVRLLIVNSSVGTDDEENRADPFQTWKSQNAQHVFLDGLENADVVFYNGHSRFGGGPDFRSPQLATNGNVDPTAYQTHKSGIKNVLASLEESKAMRAARFARLKILGLFSCTSSQHFNGKIRRVSDAALISSHQLMYYSDALNESMAELDNILHVRCSPQLTFN